MIASGATINTDFAVLVCNILKLWLYVVKRRLLNGHISISVNISAYNANDTSTCTKWN